MRGDKKGTRILGYQQYNWLFRYQQAIEYKPSTVKITVRVPEMMVY